MAPSATNLLAGAGSLHVGEFGATEPADTAWATPLSGTDWPDRGGTDDGLTLTVSRELFALRMDQVVDAPGRRMSSREITLATNLAEVTLANMNMAWGQGDDAVTQGGTGGTAYTALDLEGDEAAMGEPTYRAVAFRGRAPGGNPRLVFGRKCLSTEDVEQAYKKDEQTFIPVTFTCHWVSTSVRPLRIVDGTPA